MAQEPLLGPPWQLGTTWWAKQSIQDERWAYLHFPDADPVLFDLEADPGQTRNLAADPAFTPVVHRMMRRLLDHRIRHADRTLSEARAAPGGMIGRW